MQENQNLNSLLAEAQSDVLFEEKEESLLGKLVKENTENQESSSETLLSDVNKLDTAAQTVSDDEVKKAIELERRKAFFMNPENQATILLNDYLVANPNMFLTGHQKRMLYRAFLRKAKKGKYNRVFREQIYGVSLEDSKKAAKKFAKLN